MHEMGLAMQIAEIALSSIPEDMGGNTRVERVNLKVGKLTAVVPESLKFCFEIIIQDTPLAGSELVIEDIPVTARCRDCSREWIVNAAVFRCETCGSGAIEILSGKELDVVSIEITD
jgi:hydrogenase nickel incorporation protein HypA/HybF